MTGNLRHRSQFDCGDMQALTMRVPVVVMLTLVLL
jgi:hypothetical protein